MTVYLKKKLIGKYGFLLSIQKKLIYLLDFNVQYNVKIKSNLLLSLVTSLYKCLWRLFSYNSELLTSFQLKVNLHKHLL